jgi:hypothetical protein
MSRGLGQRQLHVIAALYELQQAAAPEDPEEDVMVPLYKLADDPDDPNEMAKARSAVRGLQQRGLVYVDRGADPDRLIESTVIGVERYRGTTPIYEPIPSSRAWSGLHAQLTPVGVMIARDMEGNGA